MGNIDNIYNVRDGSIHADNLMSVKAKVGYFSVEKWLGEAQPSTKRTSSSCMNRFMQWLKTYGGPFEGYTPDQLLDLQDKAVSNRDRYAIVDLIEKYVLSQVMSYEYRRKSLSTIRSFFAANRAELPKDPRFNIRGDVPKVRGSLTPEEIRLVILKANKTYRAAYLCMFGAALGEEELAYWSNNGLQDLEVQLEAGAKIVEIKLPGRKSKKNDLSYYSLISGDALQALKDYLVERPKGKSNAIFLNQFNEPITKQALYDQWTRYARQVGVIKPDPQTLEAITQGKRKNSSIRFGKNLHELRDTFRTLGGKVEGNRDVLEFMMGHQIDALMYNKCCNDHDWVKNQYKQFAKVFNVLTDLEPYGLIKETKAKEILEENDERVLKLERQVEELTQTIKLLTANLIQHKIALDKEGGSVVSGAEPEVPLELKEGEELTKAQIAKITSIEVTQPRGYTAEEVRKLMEYMAKKGVVNPAEIPEMVKTVHG